MQHLSIVMCHIRTYVHVRTNKWVWSTFCGCGLFGDRSVTMAVIPARRRLYVHVRISFFSERVQVVQAWDNCLVGVVVGVAYLAVQVQNCFLRPCLHVVAPMQCT